MTGLTRWQGSVKPVVGAQEPRVHVVPPYVSSAGLEAIEVAEVAGLFLDPWQKLVLTDALGETPAGRWAAYRVGLEVARQNGKGSILEARELAGLFAFGERLIIHSAHEQATATEHFNRMLALMEGVPEFDRRILKPVRGKGQEAIILRDGYRIFFKTRTGGGGRGFTGDLVVFDEAMILAAAFMAALVPTMAARSIEGDPQLWFVGSAVDQQKTEHGVEFARVRADALSAAERLAYFSWSAPFESPDAIPDAALDDPHVWALANPGMGIRISPEYVADERGALGAREFAVERLGVGDWPSPDGREFEVIAGDMWERQKDPESGAQNPVCFGVAVTPKRDYAALGVAGVRPDGTFHVGVQKHAQGTGWIAPTVKALVEEHGAVAVAARGGSAPESALIPALNAVGVGVTEKNSSDFARASGTFYDLVDQGAIWHRGTPELRAAVRVARKRDLTDGWAWSQKLSAGDITPLVAVTNALGGLIDAGAGGGGGFEWE